MASPRVFSRNGVHAKRRVGRDPEPARAFWELSTGTLSGLRPVFHHQRRGPADRLSDPARREPGSSINSNEWLRVASRDLALDLPVAEAGSNQQVEAGLWAVLSGVRIDLARGLPLEF